MHWNGISYSPHVFHSNLPIDREISEKELDFLRGHDLIMSVRCQWCDQPNHQFPRDKCECRRKK